MLLFTVLFISRISGVSCLTILVKHKRDIFINTLIMEKVDSKVPDQECPINTSKTVNGNLADSRLKTRRGTSDGNALRRMK